MTTAGLDPRRLCQIEIQVGDLVQASAFYAAAFGWRAVPADLHEMRVLEVPAGCPYGICLVPRRHAAAGGGSLTLYFQADDPEAVLAAVEAAGGRRLGDAVNLAGYGMTYLCADPDGTHFGLYTRPRHPPAPLKDELAHGRV